MDRREARWIVTGNPCGADYGYWEEQRMVMPYEKNPFRPRVDEQIAADPPWMAAAKEETTVSKQARKTEMQTEELINLIHMRNGASVVKVNLSGSSVEYSFLDALKLAPEVDDMIVVETINGLKIGKVIEINVALGNIDCPIADLRKVVQIVDRAALERLKEAETQAHAALAMAEVEERLEKYSAFTGKIGQLFAGVEENQEVIEKET